MLLRRCYPSMLIRRCSTKSAEMLSNIPLSETESIPEGKQDPPNKIRHTAIVSPTPDPERVQKWETIVGIEIVKSSLTWASMSVGNQEIIDCGHYPLLADTKRCCSSRLLEVASSAAQSIPSGHVYVMEDKIWTKGVSSCSSVSLNIIIIQAMLASLLTGHLDFEAPSHRVYYLNRNIIPRLFRLKVGNERMSSQHLVRDMIMRSENASHLPKIITVDFNDDVREANPPYSILNWPSPDMIQRLWTRDDVWRENVSNAILIACAFSDLICKSKPEAMAAIWRKDSKSKSKAKVKPS